MNSFGNTLATTVLTASVCLPTLVQAEILLNEWQPFSQVVGVNPDAPCGEADKFLFEGMSHVKISTLRNGGMATNVNSMGTFTALGSEEGAIFRQNFREVVPVLGENTVYNLGETIKIIGRPNGDNYRSNITVHVTVIGGEYKSYVEIDKAVCW